MLADGLLTGRVTSRSAAHYAVPRMEGENLEHNLQPTAVLKALAAARRCSPAQLAVAWLLSRGNDIVPVVGMSRPDRVAENLQAFDITLTDEEQFTLDSAFSPDAIISYRYPAIVMKFAAR
ncbi:aldo/keto reductase [Salmonella enterica subsp. diarizonae serovar 61:r:z53]|nr:aldo/keto reductase [Salmonella enterica subsp. diarizonae serovar 61:r:z53]